MSVWYLFLAALAAFFLFDIPYMIFSLALLRYRSRSYRSRHNEGIPAPKYIFYVSMMAIEAVYLMFVIPILFREFSLDSWPS